MIWFHDSISPNKTCTQLKLWPGKYLHEVLVQSFDKLVIKSKNIKFIKNTRDIADYGEG